MKSNLRNEIKSYIVRQGMPMQEVVDLLRDEHGCLTVFLTFQTSSSGSPYATRRPSSLPMCWGTRSSGNEESEEEFL